MGRGFMRSRLPGIEIANFPPALLAGVRYENRVAESRRSTTWRGVKVGFPFHEARDGAREELRSSDDPVKIRARDWVEC
jgi:hypothetical protein